MGERLSGVVPEPGGVVEVVAEQPVDGGGGEVVEMAGHHTVEAGALDGLSKRFGHPGCGLARRRGERDLRGTAAG